MGYLGNTPQTQGFTPAVDVFSGNGSTTAFTLSRPVASVAQVQAFIENVPQSPVDAFTVSGNTITFTSAPPSGSSNIYVRYTSPITQVISPTDGTVGTNALAAGAVTSAKMAAGAARANFGAGAVLQVVSFSLTPTFSTTSGTYTNTGISASITPSSATSKVFIAATFLQNTQASNITMLTTVFRDSTALGIEAGQYSASGGFMATTGAINFLDSPSTTSAITYSIRSRVSAGAGTISIGNPSSIVLMEIAA
jgi:hypothetical protein